MQITLIYVLVGALWVPASDRLLAALISDIETLTSIQTLKDGLFVLGTAVMLYLLIQRSMAILSRSEQVLREKHAQLSAVIEGTADAIFIKDLQGFYLAINSACMRYLGKPAQTVIGRSDAELFPADRAGLLMEKDRKVMTSGETLIFEEVFTAGEAERIYSTTKLPYRDPRGQIIGLIGIARDITESRQTEQRLRQQAQIIDQIHDSVISTDMDGNVTSWNQGAERLTGYRAEEMLGQPITRLYPPEEHSFLEHQVIAPLKEKGQHAVEVRMRKKSGEDIYAHLSLSLLRDDKGAAIGMIGYSMDITERKQMEEALRISEERFRVALKHSPITVFNQDCDLRYIWMHNPPKELAARQIVGKRDSDLLKQSEDTQRIENIKRRVLHTGIGTRQEICVHLGGVDRFYELTVEPLRTEPNGQVKGVTGAAFDITQRKLMEDEARQHQAELAHMARLSTAGEMASSMAHELSQPLMAIELSASSCLNRLKAGQFSEEVINRVQAIADQGHRAFEIIQRMKNFTRKTKLQRTGVDINALLQEVASWTRSEVRNKNVSVQFTLADSLPPVYVDAIQIQQVVLNLVRNAIDAMQDTEAGQRELCFKTAPTENHTLEVTISDTGPGLVPENADRLFKPFFTTKPGGMGLGLSISKTIIETHGGRLWATPNSNHGTAFHFTLPLFVEDSSVNELRKKIS